MIYLTLWAVAVLLAVSTSHGKRVLKVDPGDIGVFENEIEDYGHRKLASDALPEAEEHRVTNLPGLTKDDVVTQFAGHLPADPAHGGYFFYWLFESKKDADKKPLIIWLNGGPGCSSMDGLWLELGPFRIVDGGRTVKWNKYSWHEVGNLLFVDQPVGTGLSFTNGKEGLAKNDKMVNEHFYTFLRNFLSVHNRYVSPTKNGGAGGGGGGGSGSIRRRSRPIIFTGESHAGHYIPSLARYILEQNQQPENDLEIVVQGIALGNPWIDPANQYNPAEFAHGLGIINRGQVNRLKEQERQCRQLLQDGKLNNKICMNLLDDVIDASSVHNGAKVIMYDTRQYTQNANAFPPGHDAVETYLNRADVRRAIHATRTPQRYVECADPPYFALSHQDGKGVTEELSYLLDHGLPVLIYLGQYDLICNHMNMEKVLDGLWWSGRNDWLTAQPGVWMQGNRPVGYIRRYRNLQSLLVLNAGHMVPMDLPDVSLSMIQTFVNVGDFASGVSKIGVTVSPSSLCSLSTTEPTAATTATTATAATALSTTSTATSQRALERRQLLDGVRGSNHLQFYPVLIHATPLETEVFLRIRMQPLTNSGGGAGYHHSMASSSIASAHKMQQAWDALASSSFYLLIEPTDQVIRFSENRTWYTTMNNQRHPTHHTHHHNGSTITATNGTHRSAGGSGLHANQQQQQQHHLDIVVAGLQYGVVYTFSLHHEYDTATLPTHLPASFARSIHTKVGCFAAGFEQCCGRGDCVLATKQSTTPQCHCDAGYSGEHCDHYAIMGVATTVSHHHHQHHHRQLQFANVSASDSMCPRRVTPAATAFHVTLRQLPHRTTPPSLVVADAVTTPSSASASASASINTSTAAHSKPTAVKCGDGDSSGEESDVAPCCTVASMRVLHKSIAVDSNIHAHTNEYRVVQRQRLQSGLTQLLRSLASSTVGGGAAIRVQVTDLGNNEGGRRGQSLSINVCGPPAIVAAALKQFSAMVDSDTVDVKGAHDLYAIQGPVVVKAAALTAYQPTSSVAVKAQQTPTVSTIVPAADGSIKSSTLRKETTPPSAVDQTKASAGSGVGGGVTSDATTVVPSSSWSFSSVANIVLVIVAVISLSVGLARCYPRQPSSLRLYNR